MPTKTECFLANAERPPNWKRDRMLIPEDSFTFSRQPELPHLPVPALNLTLERLKCSLRPLAHSDEEWTTTERKIDNFVSDGGETLHRRLEERASSSDTEHWLEEFWDDTAYMKYREPVMVNVSYYWGFSPQPTHLPQTPAARAACLTRGALSFRRMIMQGTLPPETLKDQPLCMDSYKWMFDCCRVPGRQGADWSRAYPPQTANQGEPGASGHVIALRNGRVWKIDVSHPEGRLLNTSELERQYQHVYASSDGIYPQLGLLTATNRDSWAKDYAALVADSHNASIIHAIESSAFVVCLDSTLPSSVYEVSRGLFHGGCEGEQLGNRWYDKPCEFIVFDNGESGFLGEHSMMDGTSTSALGHWILHSLNQPGLFDHGCDYPAETYDNNSLPAPQPLDWVMTPSITKSINIGIQSSQATIKNQDMGLLTVDYGRDAIKGFGVSPDAWAQMLVQLAYHRLIEAENKSTGRRRAGGTYESAMTRKFLKGRTEAIRVVTEESMTWCDAMNDPSKSAEEKIFLLKAAAKVHGNLANNAINAQGVDRHFLGLKMMLREMEQPPELFTDPLFKRGCHWVLSTSAVFSPYFTRGYGWGQVVDDGFGVAYMTGFADRLEFTVTSLKSQPNAAFIQQLRSAASDMRALFVR